MSNGNCNITDIKFKSLKQRNKQGFSLDVSKFNLLACSKGSLFKQNIVVESLLLMSWLHDEQLQMESDAMLSKSVVEKAGEHKINEPSQLPLKRLPQCHAAGTFGYILEARVPKPATGGEATACCYTTTKADGHGLWFPTRSSLRDVETWICTAIRSWWWDSLWQSQTQRQCGGWRPEMPEWCCASSRELVIALSPLNLIISSWNLIPVTRPFTLLDATSSLWIMNTENTSKSWSVKTSRRDFLTSNRPTLLSPRLFASQWKQETKAMKLAQE